MTEDNWLVLQLAVSAAVSIVGIAYVLTKKRILRKVRSGLILLHLWLFKKRQDAAKK